MKQYYKLKIPDDSAWGRKKLTKYFHWKIRYFFDGVWNIFRWIPTIYHDRDWDDYFLTKMIQKKIEFQRDYIVNANRHTNVDYDNYWMTVILNLLEREHTSFYETEYYDYVDEDMIIEDRCLKFVTNFDNSSEYIKKYKNILKRMERKKNPYFKKHKISNKNTALFISQYNQERCRNLIFEILKTKSERWWD